MAGKPFHLTKKAERKCAFSKFCFLPNHKMLIFSAELEYKQLPATEFGGF